MMRFSTTLLPLLSAIIAVAQAQQCLQDSNPTSNPNPMQDISKYTLESSFLVIFKTIQIPCTGYLASWKVGLNTAADFEGLHLAVFRPNGKMLDFVGQNRIARRGSYFVVSDSYTLASGEPNPTDMILVNNFSNGWYQIDLPYSQKFSVNAGDVLAIYFDSWRSSRAVVPHSTNPARPSLAAGLDPTMESYSLMIDAQSLAPSFDSTLFPRVDRRPALNATVDATRGATTLPTTPAPVTTTTTLPPTTKTTMTTTTPIATEPSTIKSTVTTTAEPTIPIYDESATSTTTATTTTTKPQTQPSTRTKLPPPTTTTRRVTTRPTTTRTTTTRITTTTTTTTRRPPTTTTTFRRYPVPTTTFQWFPVPTRYWPQRSLTGNDDGDRDDGRNGGRDGGRDSDRSDGRDGDRDGGRDGDRDYNRN